MKNLLPILLGLLGVAATAQSGFAQTTVTYDVDQSSVGNQQPGSATDFIDFYANNYPFGGPSDNHNSLPNGTITSDLNSFTIQGGDQGANSDGNNFSIITTPKGQSFLTGAIEASPGIAFALSPGVFVGNTLVLNPKFNYNDFYVYLMYSNTNSTLSDTVISLDPRGGPSVPFGTHDVTVTDNFNATPGSSPTTAGYLAFHVLGLGNAIALNPSADLVVSANLPLGVPSGSYIGGLSVESVPEPSTYALMSGGLVFLALCVRRKGAMVK